MALITAHQELENCCLEREQHRIKRDIDKRWGELVYDAQWFSPATQSLNAFIETPRSTCPVRFAWSCTAVAPS